VVGCFGGNPASHPQFAELCHVLRESWVPFEQRGIWCNNPMGWGREMARTFNPAVSNLNVHQDAKAYAEFKHDWPNCHVVGLETDSRHSPPWVAMKDVIADEGRRWELISNCDINRHWSAMLCQFRGELRAFFCEVAGAQAILHQWEPDYPDTGLKIANGTTYFRPPPEYENWAPIAEDNEWWRLTMPAFFEQVRHHCHSCGIPLRGHGELANNPHGTEQVSNAHLNVARPKKPNRRVELVVMEKQLEQGRIGTVIDYLGNARR
jgi:hypothetical protein